MICFLHSCQVWVLNVLGLFGKDREFRLIPTTFFGLLHLIHFVYCLIKQENGYPALFMMARIPEIFVIGLIAFVYSLHKISFLLHNGNVRSLPLRYRDWPLSDDFSTVLFNVGITCLRTSRSLGLLNDLGPIKIPLAVGISPEYTAVIKKRFENEPQNGFLNKEENVNVPPKKSLITDRLVPWIISLGFAFTFLTFLQQGTYKLICWSLGRKSGLNNDLKQEVESDLDSDFDFDPTEIESDSDNSEVDHEDSYMSSEDENAELCEEIVNLTRDLSETHTSSNSNNLSPVGHILTLLNQPRQLITRSQVKSLETGISDRVIPDSLSSPIRNSSFSFFGEILSLGDFKFSVRNCVICQCENRSIVLRPCGCLCLCDDCRKALAARKFIDCPCCRRFVSGFSRIYEP